MILFVFVVVLVYLFIYFFHEGCSFGPIFSPPPLNDSADVIGHGGVTEGGTRGWRNRPGTTTPAGRVVGAQDGKGWEKIQRSHASRSE